MFILKILNIEAKRSKLILKSESSEAKRTGLFEISQYRSEANRFGNDFVLEITKKSELSFFFKTKGKKRKCSIMNCEVLPLLISICLKTEHALNNHL
jgi:hypothetical protein